MRKIYLYILRYARKNRIYVEVKNSYIIASDRYKVICSETEGMYEYAK